MAAPGSNGGAGKKSKRSKKRKRAEADHASNDKRMRPDGLPTSSRANAASLQHDESPNELPQGTQHNPLEIESSPEPEPRIRSRELVAEPTQPVHSRAGKDALLKLGLCFQKPGNSNKKPKYYAVAGGHVPGIYTDWASVEEQIRGFSGAKHKKFDTESDALAYLLEYMDIVQVALNRLADRSEARQSPPSNQHDYLPFSATAPSHTPAMPSPPPPYSVHDTVQPVTSGSVTQRPTPNDIAAEPEPTLSPEQQKVVDLIVEGHNVFYTGSAGCGKSTILKAFVKILKARGQRVRIVAPTNLAALNVQGQTTWSFAGWTPDSMKKSLAKLMADSHGDVVWERFDTTDVLVIDEISMVENLLFERLNRIMKESRGEKYGGGPFGGVQIVVTGDVSLTA